MLPSPPFPPPDRPHAPSALRRSAALAIAGTALALSALGAAAVQVGPLSESDGWLVVKTLFLFGAACVFVWLGLPAHAPQRRFGAANGITLGRLGLICLLAGSVDAAVGDDAALGWTVLVLATAAASLDALDGPIARQRGEATDFGARFDMETDALLVLVLSLWVWQLDKAGAWVLASGAMRYAFVAAALHWPWLGRALPPRFRRKLICVVQIVVLIVCLSPWLPAALTQVLAALGLAALSASFLIDLRWLARHRHPPGDHA